MSSLVSYLWKYGGYSSLARSLFDAQLSPGGGEIPATPLAESATSSTFDRTSSGFERRHLSDASDSAESGEGDYDSDNEEALLAWACNLSSDEDEDQEAEEEDSTIAENASGYESDFSCENEECRHADGESDTEQLYTISL